MLSTATRPQRTSGRRTLTSSSGCSCGHASAGAPLSTWCLDRGRENRSQLVFTKARGRDAVSWQSPRTRKQARPDVRTPTARAAGIADLEIVADSHEQYPYRFASQQATVVKRALPCGDYGLIHTGRLIASVERKSLTDLVASLTGGKLRYALAELAALPRAAVVVEDRYSAIFKLDRRATGDGRRRSRRTAGPLPRTSRSSSARPGSSPRSGPTGSWPPPAPGPKPRPPHSTAASPLAGDTSLGNAPAAPGPATAEVRAWARAHGITVPSRGKLRREIWDAWRTAHPDADGELSEHVQLPPRPALAGPIVDERRQRCRRRDVSVSRLKS